MLIVSLLCCRRSSNRRKEDELDGLMTGFGTTSMNTASQRTFTSNSVAR